jgi:hypothetical protein
MYLFDAKARKERKREKGNVKKQPKRGATWLAYQALSFPFAFSLLSRFRDERRSRCSRVRARVRLRSE